LRFAAVTDDVHNFNGDLGPGNDAAESIMTSTDGMQLVDFLLAQDFSYDTVCSVDFRPPGEGGSGGRLDGGALWSRSRMVARSRTSAAV
jgi:hypothetical protein